MNESIFPSELLDRGKIDTDFPFLRLADKTTIMKCKKQALCLALVAVMLISLGVTSKWLIRPLRLGYADTGNMTMIYNVNISDPESFTNQTALH